MKDVRSSATAYSPPDDDIVPSPRERAFPAKPFLAVVLLVLTLGWSTPGFVRRFHVQPFHGEITTAMHGHQNPAYLVEAAHGAVASENGVCSEIGVQALKDGGNAVDAAVSTVFCIGVANMFSAGIGGGGFMTVRLPPTIPNGTSEVWSIDFREVGPARANATMYAKDPQAAMYGGLSVGVPGELRGMEEAHTRWGKLPWARLVQPSVDLAAGWTVGIELGRRINLKFYESLMTSNPDWRSIFAPNSVRLQAGDPISRANLSRTLAAVAKHGADAFYKGEIAEAMVRKIRTEGGIMTLEDLANYKVKVARALQGTYRGRKIYTPHAPTSGPVIMHMLNLLENYDFIKEGRTGLNVHRYVEAMKFGFAARTKLCDPDFTDDLARIQEIPRKTFSTLVGKNLTDDRTHPPEYYQPVYDIPEDHGTSHVSVVDQDGMAASVTSTVNLVFGSQVMDPVTGVIFNDEMDDFSTPGRPNAFGLWPSPFNYPEAHKRPLSSTVPLIMEHEDGSFYLAAGGSGGSKIFPAVFQVILNLDWGYDVSAAIESGRLHDQLYPEYVEADNIFPGDLLAHLEAKGHNIRAKDINRVAAVVNAVVRQNSKVFAASDSRKNGIAAGY